MTIREFFGTFLGMNRIIKESQKGKFIKEFLTLVRHLTMRPVIAALGTLHIESMQHFVSLASKVDDAQA